jgi:Peptidase_C39 like family
MKAIRKKVKKTSRKKTKIILLSLLGVVLLLVVFNWDRFQAEDSDSLSNKEVVTEKSITEKEETLSQNVIKPESEFEEVQETKIKKESEIDNEARINIKIPYKIQRDVSFAPQAPFSVWDELHEEACEEASLIMVKFHLGGKSLTKQKMEDEIQDLVDYQNEEYGDYKDSDMKELKKIAEDYYEIENIKIVKNFTKEDIKKYLTNSLIIVPTAGRELGNPNFTAPGPLYHNLVLIGYNGNTIITNDPGTRKGKNYIYDENVLFEAIHDFPGSKKKILNGEKVMLVFPLE